MNIGKEFKELKELISSIAFTAKLLDYKVDYKQPPRTSYEVRLTHPITGGIIVLTLYISSSKVILETVYGGSRRKSSDKTSHQTKIDHLKKIIEERL